MASIILGRRLLGSAAAAAARVARRHAGEAQSVMPCGTSVTGAVDRRLFLRPGKLQAATFTSNPADQGKNGESAEKPAGDAASSSEAKKPRNMEDIANSLRGFDTSETLSKQPEVDLLVEAAKTDGSSGKSSDDTSETPMLDAERARARLIWSLFFGSIGAATLLYLGR